ncbi:hypothetical protein M8C21_001302, partial [Ambrosia artemisiifolia]
TRAVTCLIVFMRALCADENIDDLTNANKVHHQVIKETRMLEARNKLKECQSKVDCWENAVSYGQFNEGGRKALPVFACSSPRLWDTTLNHVVLSVRVVFKLWDNQIVDLKYGRGNI